MEPSDLKPARVFISYSQKDRIWLEKLQVFLRQLEREHAIERWDDSRLVPGSSWKEEIESAIEAANVAILLVSQDFLASEFIASDELPPLLAAAESRGLVIIPVILRPCLFEHTPSLSRFQAVNNPKRPLVNLSSGQREEMWVRVVTAVEYALRPGPPKPPPPGPRQPPEEEAPELQPTNRNSIDGAEMILIPAGEFIMGSEEREDEKPPRTVYLDAYYIYKTPVTVLQYRMFCKATNRNMADTPPWGRKNNHPVINVSWEDASAYAGWAGVRLPTEAQWEKAARGGDGRRYPWGNEWDPSRCRYSKDKTGASCVTAPVASHLEGASPFGVQDMAGNVWEWCADWYGDRFYNDAPRKNPLGPKGGQTRVLRGGSAGTNRPSYFRCSSRFGSKPEYRDVIIGFRCAAGANSL